MRALERKLARDLWSLKAQVLSIALVIACGLGGFIATFSTYASLVGSRDAYYDQARLPHVFASATRAPLWALERARAIAGVSEAEARVVRDAQLALEGVDPPMIARLIGYDFERRPGMNRLTLTGGRWPAAGSRSEVVVNQRFVEARGVDLGDALRVLVNGKLERLVVVGTVLSPEYIYPTRGTGMPDDEWFAIVWMDARALSAALDMEGAFNSLLLRLEHGASQAAAIDAVDRILAPFGGRGAIGREDQPSHRILEQEIDQQRVIGTIMPAIFLAVAAFILNVVLHRQVNAQRGEIAALKALGYSGRDIALHYLGLAAAIVLAGVAAGVALGAWLGRDMTGLYTEFFHFPTFDFHIPPWVVVVGSGVSLAAAFGGTLAAIRGILRLRAAEALRPPAPAQFRPLLVERLGYARLLTPAQRMVMRNLERTPVRAAITVAGIAGSVAILISGIFWNDAVGWFMEVQFNHVNRGDVVVGLVEAAPASVTHDLARFPGVLQVGAHRTIPARLSSGNRTYRTAVNGVHDDAVLARPVGLDERSRMPAPGGVLLTTRLAKRLGVAPGGHVDLQLLEGRGVVARYVVTGTVSEMAGLNAWMRLDELNGLAGEGPLVNAVQLRIDAGRERELLARLKDTPAAGVVVVNRALLETFRATNARNLLFFTFVLTAFAAVIAVGVVYNNARIQLAERAWELASLRVLGFTRREVSVFLLGELAVEVALAIPLGLAAGLGLAALLIALMPHDLFEIPLVILPSTYVYAAATVAAAGVASALIVRNRIDRLDLVAVLKTRE